MKRVKRGCFAAKIAAALLTATLAGTMAVIPAKTVYATEVSEMPAQNATITADSVRVRSGAGTSYDVLGNMSNGETTVISGQANDSEGNVWYQIDFNGAAGFIRNDFLQLGEMVEGGDAEGGEAADQPMPEEAPPVEESQPAEQTSTPIVSSQYVAMYEEDDQGTYYWYLHNNDEGYRVKIDDLLDAAKSVDEIEGITKKNKTYKTAVIIMGVVIALLAVIMVILIFRLKDYMYYDPDEEEEEIPEEQHSRGSFFKRKREDEDLEEEEPPQRPARRGSGARDYAEEQPRTTGRSSRQQSQDRRPPQRETRERPRESEQTRRARNVMRDDDDLEYEFLNLDDDN